jgi:hypothetical protein
MKLAQQVIKWIVAALCLLVVVNVYNGYYGMRYKGEYAASNATLRNVRIFADEYRQKQGSFEGFCDDRSYRDVKERIESIKRAGIFNWDAYRVECIANEESYAVSMTSYIDLFGDKTPYTHLCTAYDSGETLLKQNRHVIDAHCDAQLN